MSTSLRIGPITPCWGRNLRPSMNFGTGRSPRVPIRATGVSDRVSPMTVVRTAPISDHPRAVRPLDWFQTGVQSPSETTPMTRIETRQLACGMPLLVEPMEGVRSAALSWMMPAGVRG